MNAIFIKRYLQECANIMVEEKEYLIELDSVVGDGDLGLTMSDGFTAAYNTICELDELDIGKLLYQAGKAMANAVPSTMGTLMASGLMSAGKALKGKTEVSNLGIVTIFKAYEEGVMNRGKACVGDKTFLDGLHPGIMCLQEHSESTNLHEAATLAYEAAKKGYEDTVGMLAIHGRAATRGEASRELKDPGAYVGMLLMKALCACSA